MTNYLELASPQDREKVQNIKELFHKLNAQTDKFQKATALRCAEGCGRCCENPDVETTVLEMLPLAYELWQSGRAEAVLDNLSDVGKGTRCVLYQPDPLKSGNGRCSAYHQRPLICRLFGYSVKHNKYGQEELVTCTIMKDLCVKECVKIPDDLRAGLPAPNMQDYAMEAYYIDPIWAKDQIPINKAIVRAIEKVGMLKLKDNP